MVQRAKLLLNLNERTEVTLLYDEAIVGTNQFGSYNLLAIKSGGCEYSYFPNDEVYSQIKELRKGDTFFITKTARQTSGNKVLCEYILEVPAKQLPKASELSDKSLPETNINTQQNEVPAEDRLYNIMLQSYREALKIAKEFEGIASVPQIATTLFIARSRTNGVRYE
jgi:hypothetical protein